MFFANRIDMSNIYVLFLARETKLFYDVLLQIEKHLKVLYLSIFLYTQNYVL